MKVRIDMVQEEIAFTIQPIDWVIKSILSNVSLVGLAVKPKN